MNKRYVRVKWSEECHFSAVVSIDYDEYTEWVGDRDSPRQLVEFLTSERDENAWKRSIIPGSERQVDRPIDTVLTIAELVEQ